MANVLSSFEKGKDARALIFDAKGDTPAFLRHIACNVPAATLSPFARGNDFVSSVRWKIQSDISSPARALNLATTLVPAEKGGNNQYFTDAARQVIAAITESFIRHSPNDWSFSDLVLASTSREDIKTILSRDWIGKETLDNFFADADLAFKVHSTIVSRMAYFRPIAALWQKTANELSIREWLQDDSILLLGTDETCSASLDAINDVLFRIVSEEIDIQSNSETRRTWIWLDEARLAAPILRSGKLSRLAVKGRSRGAALVVAFQDIDGFREAAGTKLANEIVAQCSHKALLRMESEEGAVWASKLLGQFEAIELFHSKETLAGRQNVSEQRVNRDAVMASQFYTLSVTSRSNGLSGYFVSPHVGATLGHVAGNQLQPIVISDSFEDKFRLQRRSENEQWLSRWKSADKQRLCLEKQRDLQVRNKLELSARPSGETKRAVRKSTATHRHTD